MSDRNLKKKIIRLAYQNPDLRGDLLPLIQKQASLPRATRRPPGEKFREKLAEWLKADVQTKLGNGGVPQNIIDSAIDTITSSYPASGPLWSRVRRNPKKFRYFKTQQEAVDWIAGKHILDTQSVWASYPKYMNSLINNYGSAGDTLRDKAKANFNVLKPHQKAFAAAWLGYGGDTTIRHNIKELSDQLEDVIKGTSIKTLDKILPVLEWAAKVPKPPVLRR